MSCYSSYTFSYTVAFLLKETMIHSVVYKFLFKVPGMKIILEANCCTPSAAVRFAKGGKSLLADHLEEALYKKSRGSLLPLSMDS